MQKARLALLLAALAAFSACTATKNYQKDLDDANAKGKYKVRLTTDPEVVGQLQVREDHPAQPGPRRRSRAVAVSRLLPRPRGSDGSRHGPRPGGTVGEAYICGPTPLNPDGTPKALYDTPPQHP